MHVEQSPNCPYRSAQNQGSPSSCLFTCHHFHSMGVQPHSWEPQLLPPARPVREQEQSWQPPLERCECHRETLPRMLSALLGWLRSQLSSWGVGQGGGITAARCRDFTAHRVRAAGRTPIWDAWNGMTQEEQLSLGAPNPLPQSSPHPLALQMWQGIHPAGLRVLLSKRDASLPSRAALGGGCASAAGPARRAALATEPWLTRLPDRQQLPMAFYQCQADGEQEHLLLFPGAAAVCSAAGEGCPCPAWAGESVPAFSSGDAEVAALQRKCPFCLGLHQPTVWGESCLCQQLELGGKLGLLARISLRVTQLSSLVPKASPATANCPQRKIQDDHGPSSCT